MKKALFILLICQLIMSCGQSNFSKRHYTKGVYIQKHSTAKAKKLKKKKEEVHSFSNENFTSNIENDKSSKKKEHSSDIKVALNEEEYGSKNRSGDDQDFQDTGSAKKEIVVQTNKGEESPPEINDGEELEKSSVDSHSKKAIIFGSLAIGLLILAVSIFLLDFFIVLSGFLMGFGYFVGIFGAGSMGVLGVIFGALGVKRGGGTKAKVGLTLAAATLAIILILIVLSFIFLI